MVPCWFQPIGFLCASSIFLKVGEIPQSVFSDQTQNWRSVLNFAIITVIFGHNMLTFHKDWNDIAKKESQTWLFAMYAISGPSGEAVVVVVFQIEVELRLKYEQVLLGDGWLVRNIGMCHLCFAV